MRGLRGRPPPGPRQAMLLRRCRSVHTFGMEQPITVVFLDREMTVIRLRRSKTKRLVVGGRRTRHVLETGIGSEVRVGDRFSRAAG
jgi:uncharacterized protein